MHSLFGLGPQPGDVYREYTTELKVKNNWRVTDPDAANPGAAKYLGLEGYGLRVTGRVPIEIQPNEVNKKYLQTKKEKMGHLLS